MSLKFTIVDYTTNPTGDSAVVNEPVGWDSTTLRLKRDKNWHGFFDFFDDSYNNMQWHGIAADILKSAYQANGVQANCRLLVEYACADTDTYLELYTGKFVFAKYTEVCGDMCYIECGVEDSNCLMAFKNRYDQKVDLDTLTPMDACSCDDTAEVTGGFDDTGGYILITSVPGGVAALTCIKPGNSITITGSVGNSGTYTVASVTITDTAAYIYVAEPLTPEPFSVFTISGCLFTQQLTPYQALNTRIQLPGKMIRQISKLVNPETGPIEDISHHPDHCGIVLSNPGDVLWSPNCEAEFADIETTGFIGFGTCKRSGTHPEDLDGYYTDYDGYLKFGIISELKCQFPHVNIRLDIEADVFTDSDNSKEYAFNVFLTQVKADGTRSYTPLLTPAVVVPMHSNGASFHFPIHNDYAMTISPGDRVYLQFSWLAIAYFSGDGNADAIIDEPLKMWFQWDEFKFEATADSYCEPTHANVYMVNEALSRITEVYTNDCLRVKSDYFGRTNSQPYVSDVNGCGALQAITSGLKVRNVSMQDGTKPKVTISMKEMFDNLNAIHNIGLGVEDDTIRGGKWIRVEPVQHFYNNTVLIECNSVREIKTSLDQSAVYSTAKIGYAKWETENTNGLNDMFSRREYRTALTQLTNPYDRICNFIASDYALEVTRRKYGNSTVDWRYDNDIFILCLQNYFFGLGEDETTAFVAPHTITLNGIAEEGYFAPGHQIQVTGTLGNAQDGVYDITAVSIAGGSTQLTVSQTVTSEIGIPVIINITNPIRRVEIDNIESSANLLSPETCMNTRITPARNAMRHLHSVFKSYANYTNGALLFTNGTGNISAQTDINDTDDCVLENGMLAENQDLVTTGFANPEKAYPFYKPELVKFEYPVTWQQYLTIKENPYGLIGYQCGSGPMQYGWIEDFQLKPYTGMGQFTLRPKIES